MARTRASSRKPSSRTAAARRSPKPEAPPAPSPDPDLAGEKLRPESATIDVAPPPAPASSSSADAAAAAQLEAEAATLAGGELHDALGGVVTPEAAGMLLEAMFGVAAVATRSPEIWQATSDEITPLEKPLAHQIVRLPFVQTIGVDNTELGILIIGLLVMVTTRLNEYAQKRQLEISRPAAARRSPEAATAAAPADRGERSAADLMSLR